MEIVKIIFSACSNVMQLPINMFGYTITLYNVLVYGFVAFALLLLFFKVTK